MSLDREELEKLGIRFPLIKERKLPKDNGFSSRDYEKIILELLSGC
jgi:hypothetical protein